MVRLIPRRNKPTGTPPGTVIYTGQQTGPVNISVFDYTDEQLTEHSVVSIADALKLCDRDSVTWINLDGVHDTQLITEIGERLELHGLLQEDIASPHQRPKADTDGPHTFLVLRMLRFDRPSASLNSEQVSMIIGPRYVVTFQETPGDVLDTVRDRIRSKGGRIRRRGAGYLAYAIIDAIVDHYFVVVDDIGDLADSLEEELLEGSKRSIEARINNLRRVIIQTRRAVWPVRELIHSLEKVESVTLDRDMHPFLRDLSDHVSLIIDAIEALRDSTTGLLEFHHATLTSRANEIMKTLTIIASLFIPLTFIAGVYGMNFEYMPELAWPLAYPAVVVLMFSIAVSLLVFFKRRGWF